MDYLDVYLSFVLHMVLVLLKNPEHAAAYRGVLAKIYDAVGESGVLLPDGQRDGHSS